MMTKYFSSGNGNSTGTGNSFSFTSSLCLLLCLLVLTTTTTTTTTVTAELIKDNNHEKKRNPRALRSLLNNNQQQQQQQQQGQQQAKEEEGELVVGWLKYEKENDGDNNNNNEEEKEEVTKKKNDAKEEDKAAATAEAVVSETKNDKEKKKADNKNNNDDKDKKEEEEVVETTSTESKEGAVKEVKEEKEAIQKEETKEKVEEEDKKGSTTSSSAQSSAQLTTAGWLNIDEEDDDHHHEDNTLGICRVSLQTTYSSTHGDHNHREKTICDIVTPYGISDTFLQTDFPIELVTKNKFSLLNRTWFVSYNRKWVERGDGPNAFSRINKIIFPDKNNIQSLSLDEVTNLMENQRRRLIKKQQQQQQQQNQNNNNNKKTSNLRPSSTYLSDRDLKASVELHSSHFSHYTATTGNKKTIVIMVDSSMSKQRANELIFGNGGNSFKTQIAACSNNLVTLTPYDSNNITNTIIDLKPQDSISRYTFPELYSELVHDLRYKYDVPFMFSISNVADLFLFIVGDHINCGPGEVAWAPVGGFHFGIKESWVTSTQTMLHEFGHNLGNSHAWEDDVEYEDTSTVMGASEYVTKRCYNAQNMWRMDWYPNNRMEIKTLLDPNQRIELAFYGDVAKTNSKIHPVIIKIGNIFLSFNRAIRFNSETGEYPDSLLIVQEHEGRVSPYTNLIDSIPMNSNGIINSVVNTLEGNKQNHTFVELNFLKGNDLYIAVCDHISSSSSHEPDRLIIAIGKNENGCATMQ